MYFAEKQLAKHTVAVALFQLLEAYQWQRLLKSSIMRSETLRGGNPYSVLSK
jgi:hypothetical protein